MLKWRKKIPIFPLRQFRLIFLENINFVHAAHFQSHQFSFCSLCINILVWDFISPFFLPISSFCNENVYSISVPALYLEAHKIFGFGFTAVEEFCHRMKCTWSLTHIWCLDKTLDFRLYGGWWNELKLWGLLGWNECSLSVRRTWILSQGRNVMDWMFVSTKISMFKP